MERSRTWQQVNCMTLFFGHFFLHDFRPWKPLGKAKRAHFEQKKLIALLLCTSEALLLSSIVNNAMGDSSAFALLCHRPQRTANKNLNNNKNNNIDRVTRHMTGWTLRAMTIFSDVMTVKLFGWHFNVRNAKLQCTHRRPVGQCVVCLHTIETYRNRQPYEWRRANARSLQWHFTSECFAFFRLLRFMVSHLELHKVSYRRLPLICGGILQFCQVRALTTIQALSLLL